MRDWFSDPTEQSHACKRLDLVADSRLLATNSLVVKVDGIAFPCVSLSLVSPVQVSDIDDGQGLGKELSGTSSHTHTQQVVGDGEN
jgi:hypothetical protein